MKRRTLSLLLFIFLLPCDVWASDDIESAGTALVRYVLPVTAAGMTLFYHDRPGALQFVKASVLTIVVTEGLKETIPEKRPNGGDNAFPSGHTSSAFSSAEFIRKRYGCRFGCPAYALATFVGYSRVEAQKHFVHDVVAGAAIGIASSYFFTHPYKGWDISYEGDTHGIGVLFTKAWP